MTDIQRALLAALRAGPGYGLDLIDRVKSETAGAIVPSQGTIYPALRQLEAEGLLESYDGEPLPERGGWPRRFYRLTENGRRTLCDATLKWSDEAKAFVGWAPTAAAGPWSVSFETHHLALRIVER